MDDSMSANNNAIVNATLLVASCYNYVRHKSSAREYRLPILTANVFAV